MKAIGILGGAFAPLHNGHLRLALEALNRLGLDEVRLIPTAQAPHRNDSHVSPQRRLEWVKAAIRREKALVADDCELLRDGPSYTVDTLAGLRAAHPDAALVLIMGADAFAHLHTWHRWQDLFELAHLAVATRPGAVPCPSPETAAFLDARRARSAEALRAGNAGCWIPLEIPQLDISSTRIRRLLQCGRSVRGLVPDAILHAMTAADIAALTQNDNATKH